MRANTPDVRAAGISTKPDLSFVNRPPESGLKGVATWGSVRDAFWKPSMREFFSWLKTVVILETMGWVIMTLFALFNIFLVWRIADHDIRKICFAFSFIAFYAVYIRTFSAMVPDDPDSHVPNFIFWRKVFARNQVSPDVDRS